MLRVCQLRYNVRLLVGGFPETNLTPTPWDSRDDTKAERDLAVKAANHYAQAQRRKSGKVLCQHIGQWSSKRCSEEAAEGYPLCQWHLEHPTDEDIRLVEVLGGDATRFEALRGRRVTNPLEELSKLAGEVLLYKDWCAHRLREVQDRFRYEGKAGEQLRSEVSMYERSLDRCSKLLTDWGKLNIDERLSRIEEKKAQAIISVIQKALLAANLTAEQRDVIETVIVGELQKLAPIPQGELHA